MTNPLSSIRPEGPLPAFKTTAPKALVGKSWLASPPSDLSNFNLKMFAHEMGDPFIGESALEGNHPWYTLSRFKDVMGKIAGDLPWVDSCLKYAKEMLLITDLKGVSALAEKVTKEVTNLKPFESAWLPGGWTTGDKDEGGHALLYQITRQKNGKYSFTVFNTGEGLQEHEKIITFPKTQEKFQTFLTYEDISAEKICQEDVFKSLIELETVPKWDKSIQCSANNIYKGILPALGGKRAKPMDPGKEGEFYQKAQRSGTCSMESIFAAHHKSVLDSGKSDALKEYKHEKYLYEKQSLIDAMAEYDPLPWNHSWHKLITEASAKFSRMLLKIELPEQELLDAKASLQAIETKLSEKKASQIVPKIAPEEPCFESDQIGISSAPFKQESQEIAIVSKSETQEASKIVQVPTLSAFPTDPKDALTYLKETKEKLTDLKNQCDYHSDLLTDLLNRTIQSFSVPLQGVSSDYWSQVPEGQIDGCLENLFEISRMLMSSKAQGEPRRSKTTVLSLYTALAISDRLARRQPKNHLEGQKVNYYDLLQFAESEQVWLLNRKEQTLCSKLLDYFNTEFDLSRPLKSDTIDAVKQHSLFSYSVIRERSYYSYKSFTIIDNTTIKFVKGLKYYNEFLKDLPKEVAQLSQKEQVAKLYCETLSDKALLPDSVKYLRQMTYFAWGSIHETVIDNDEMEKELKNKENIEFNGYESDKKTKAFSVSGLHVNSDPFKYDQFRSKHPDFGIRSQNEVIQNFRNEGQRETGGLTFNVLDEVVRAVALWEDKSMEALEKKDAQNSLMAHFFRPRRLLGQLVDEPRVSLKLFAFINLRLDHFKASKKWDTAAYFAKLGHHLNAFIEEAKLESPEKFAKIASELKGLQGDYRNILLTDILPHCNDSRERTSVLNTLTTLHTELSKESITDQVALNLFLPLAFLQKSSISESNLRELEIPLELLPNIRKFCQDSESYEERNQNSYLSFYDIPLQYKKKVVQLLMSRENKSNNNIISLSKFHRTKISRSPQVEALFEDPKTRDAILNQSLFAVTFEKTDLHWEGKYPRYETDGYAIDIEKSTVAKEGKVLVGLDYHLKDNNDFSHVFGNAAIEEVSFEDPNIFITDDKGVSKILWQPAAKTEQGEIKRSLISIERKMEGVDYQYISYRMLPAMLESACPSSIINSESVIWFSKEANPPHYLVEGKGGEKFYLNLQENEGELTLQSISKDKEGKRILVNPWTLESMKPFSNFEEKDEIACFAKNSNKNKVESIEIKRYNLHFQIGANNKAFCKEIPGYFVAKDSSQFEGKWHKFLLLENEAGKQKILLPKVKLFRDSDEKGFYQNLSSGESFSKGYFSFDVENVSGKESLSAPSLEGQLYLVYAAMAKKNYNKALTLLSKSASLEPYKEVEKKLLQEVLSFKETHPAAVLMRLRAGVMLAENTLKYTPKEKNELLDKEVMLAVAKDYMGYLNNLDSYTTGKLSTAEEEFLLLQFHKMDDKFFKEIEEDIARLGMGSVMNKIIAHSIKIPAMFFEGIIAERSKILTGEKGAEKGIKKAETPQTVPKDKPSSLDSSFFSWIQKPLKVPEKTINLSETEFLESFSQFYTWAQEGTPEEKERLARILSFAIGSKSYEKADVYTAVSLLQGILKTRFRKGSIPSIKALTELKAEKGGGLSNAQWKVLKRLDGLLSQDSTLKNYAGKVLDFVKLPSRASKPLFKRVKVKPAVSITPLPSLLKPLDQRHQEVRGSLLEKFFSKNEIPGDTELKLNLDSDAEKVKDLQQELLDFYKERPKTTLSISLKGPIEDFETELRKEANRLDKELAKEKREILQAVNEVPESMKVTSHLLQLGKKRKKLLFEEAVALFEGGAQYSEKTFLGEKEIGDFENKMGAYLISATRHQQLKRILGDIESHKNAQNPKEKALLEQRMGDELLAERQYLELPFKEQDIPRSFLVFEYRNAIFLRKKQAVTLQDILERPDRMQLLAQLGTGSGKSKVMASLLEWLRAKCARTVINFWPESLYNDNKNDIRSQIQMTFNQRADTFEFDRNTDVGVENLDFINRELDLASEEKRQLNAIPASAQSLDLKFIEALRDKNERAIEDLKKPLNLFLESEGHIDEGHINLSSKREVNFTVGTPFIETRAHVEAIEGIYRLLVENEELKSLFNLQDNLQYLVPEEKFKTAIAPKIAAHFADKFQVPKEAFTEYVLGKTASIPDFVQNHPKRGEIGLLRGELTLLLPESLAQSANVHFGLTHIEGGVEYAKPYDANDSPVEGAEYDNIHEALNKSFQIYLYQGLSHKNLWQLVNYLQRNALREARLKKIETKDTTFAAFYKTHFPKEMGDLFALCESDIPRFAEQIKKNPNLALYYVTNLVAPTIKKYPYTLKSNSQNFRSMFGSLMTMTATPGSEHAYGPEMAYRADVGSDAAMLHALKTKCAGKDSVHTLKAIYPKEIVKEIMNSLFTQGTNFRMIIDIGALFKGISNIEVARGILTHFNKVDPGVIQGVVFYHNDKKMVLCEGDTDPIPFELCQLKPENLFTYADNKRMFGMDVKQMPQAKGVATFDTHIDKDDLLQGVGRLREFLKEQNVEFVLTEKTKEAIGPNAETADFDLLLGHAIANQAVKEKESTFRSMKQQMQNELRQVLMRKLVLAKTTEESLALFDKFEKELVMATEQDPFLLYGQIEKEMSGVDALLQFRKALKKKVSAQEGLTLEEKTQVLGQLKLYKQKIQDLKANLPQTVRESAIDTGTEVQQNVKIEMETKIEHRNQIGGDLPKRKETPWSKELNLFNGNWFSPMNATVSKITALTPKIFPLIQKVGKKFDAAIPEFYKNSFRRHTFKTILLTVTVGLPIVATVAALYLVAISPLLLSFTVTIPIDITRHFWNKARPSTGCDIFSLHDVLRRQEDKTLTGASEFYKKGEEGEILLTNNFCEQKSRTIFRNPPVTPLGPEQKNLHEVLVIEEILSTGKKKYTLMMLDQDTDAGFFRKKLAADKSQHDRKVCLYDLHSKIVQDSNNPFDLKDLNENPEFQTLLLKAKLYNGDIEYTDKELAEIDGFSLETKEKIWPFYEQSLAYKDSKRSRLAGSGIELALNPQFSSEKRESSGKLSLPGNPRDASSSNQVRTGM